MEDETSTTTEATAAPAAPLDPKLNAAVDAWWGAVTENLGPHITTVAYNILSAQRDNLKAVLAAATN